MKSKIFVLSAMLCVMALLLSSCVKEGASRFKGNYSFKTSGTLEFTASIDDGTGLPVTHAITPESGQMDIVSSAKGSDNMIVTMNILGGDVIAFNAHADGKVLTLMPVARRIPLNVSIGSQNLSIINTDVIISGYGERFADVVIFRLNYSGGYDLNGVGYKITKSRVDCVAKLN